MKKHELYRSGTGRVLRPGEGRQSVMELRYGTRIPQEGTILGDVFEAMKDGHQHTSAQLAKRHHWDRIAVSGALSALYHQYGLVWRPDKLKWQIHPDWEAELARRTPHGRRAGFIVPPPVAPRLAVNQGDYLEVVAMREVNAHTWTGMLVSEDGTPVYAVVTSLNGNTKEDE